MPRLPAGKYSICLQTQRKATKSVMNFYVIKKIRFLCGLLDFTKLTTTQQREVNEFLYLIDIPFPVGIGHFYILAKSYTFVSGVSMLGYALPAWEIEQLKKFHKTLKQKYEAYRINAIILLGSGWTPTQVAEVLLISEESV
jgi:hypothetical protein